MSAPCPGVAGCALPLLLLARLHTLARRRMRAVSSGLQKRASTTVTCAHRRARPAQEQGMWGASAHTRRQQEPTRLLVARGLLCCALLCCAVPCCAVLSCALPQ